MNSNTWNFVRKNWIISIALNRIISVRYQYLKQYNCVQTNEFWLV